MSTRDIINPRLWDVGEPEAMTAPLRWRKPSRVSVQGVFRDGVSFEFADRVFAVMALCPQHTFQVLTKRPDRMAEYLAQSDLLDRVGKAEREVVTPEARATRSTKNCIRMSRAKSDTLSLPLPNVWLGTSVEDQARADERIPHLLRCPAAVRFLSCEPLLGPVDLDVCGATPCDAAGGFPDTIGRPKPWPGVNWVIVGGESGPNARPCDVAWIRSIVKQCADAEVPCFVKQLGARPVETNHGPEMPMRWRPDDGGEAVERWYRPADRKGADPSEWPEDLRVRQFPEVRP